MLDVYTAVFGSPNDDATAHDERVTSVTEGLLKAYISTVQWGFAAHCMQAASISAPLHLKVAHALPDEPKATPRGPSRPPAIFHGDFGTSEMATAINNMMHTAAEQAEALQADSLKSQASTVAVGAWRWGSSFSVACTCSAAVVRSFLLCPVL